MAKTRKAKTSKEPSLNERNGDMPRPQATAPASTPALTARDTIMTDAQITPTKNDMMIEMGQSGLQRYSGIVSEEFLKELQGRNGVRIYREMAENDSTVGALLFAIEMLFRDVKWDVEPCDPENPDDVDLAEFVKECMDDMEETWAEFMSEILSMLTYGWSYHEVVYKKRVGPKETDPTKKSKYDDGKIGWRKFPIRAQETLLRWEFDANGDILGMTQQAPPSYAQITIPMAKAMLFRTRRHKNNPEGRSILRNAYRAWYYKKRIEEIESIGIERDLAGFPVLTVPGYMMNPSADAETKAIYAEYKNIIRNIRRDEQEGLIIPSDTDDKGKPMFQLTLLSTGSRRQFDTNAIIERKSTEIAMTALADFIMIGHQETGTFGMHEDKTRLFAVAIGGWLSMITETLTRCAIPALRDMNGMSGDAKFVPSDLEHIDLTKISDFITKLVGAGWEVFPDEGVDEWLRRLIKMPARTIDPLQPLDGEEADNESILDDEEPDTQDDSGKAPRDQREEEADGPGADQARPRVANPSERQGRSASPDTAKPDQRKRPGGRTRADQ